MSGEYDAPSLSSDSSQNIPQVATCPWIHTCSRLILQQPETEKGFKPVTGLACINTRKRMGGSPIRAIAVLSFLLFPPLQWRHTHTSLIHHLERTSPVLPTLFVGVLCEVQLVNGGGDHISDARLWNTSQSCKHGQELSPCHPLYQSIKLRTVANLLLDLRPIFVALSHKQ